jgi:RNA polymerase sigma-70 factor (ECF subfamily)
MPDDTQATGLASRRAQGGSQELCSERERHLTDLLLRAQRGDPEAFAFAVQESRPLLAARLLKCSQTRAIADDIEDALQDGSLNAWESLASYRPEDGPAGAWLWVLTRNAAIDLLRRRKGRRRVSLEVEQEASREPDPGAAAEAAERTEAAVRLFRQALAAASPAVRRVCELRLLEGKAYAEISSQLGVPLGTIATQIHRFKKGLRGTAA